MSWKPIETAPKDGTTVLVAQAYADDGVVFTYKAFIEFVQCAVWDDYWGSWVMSKPYPEVESRDVFFEPTHWMPIPRFHGGDL